MVGWRPQTPYHVSSNSHSRENHSKEIFGRCMALQAMKRLNTGERKIWRRIYGAVVEQGIWRMRKNQELRDLCTDLGHAVT